MGEEFGFAGVIWLHVRGNGTPEVDAIVVHAVLRDLLVANTIKTEDGVELIYVHHPVDTEEAKFNLAPILPIGRP